ncbi:unnamed protein product, partial [Rhizoctonia solani]
CGLTIGLHFFPPPRSAIQFGDSDNNKRRTTNDEGRRTNNEGGTTNDWGVTQLTMPPSGKPAASGAVQSTLFQPQHQPTVVPRCAGLASRPSTVSSGTT